MRLAADTGEVNMHIATRCICELQFIRQQLRLITEHLNEDDLQDIKDMECCKGRGSHWIEYYMDVLKKNCKDVTIFHIAAGQIVASIFGQSGDRLQQLEHPAMKHPLIQRIVQDPKGVNMNHDEAKKRFLEVADSLQP